jgi:hypothetical protein
MRFIPRVIKESGPISSKKPQRLRAIASISFFCCVAALGQGNTPIQEQAAKSSHIIPKAPVGHRQPTPRDLSATKGSDDSGLLGDDADDKALDKKIKSICRGCF